VKKMDEIKCGCHTCNIEVDPIEHFTAKDGRMLCEKHSRGVEPCSKRFKNYIKTSEKKRSSYKFE